MKLYAYAIGAAGLVAAVWYYGHTRYNAGQDDIRAEVAKQVAKATAETARIEAERDAISRRIESELLPRIQDADANARDLARRLRLATSRRAVPQAAGPAADAATPSGEPADGGEIERATEDHFAACARDAERLNGLIEWYEAVSAN